MDAPLDEQPAEQRGDYRFFRALTRFTASLTIAGLVFTAWRLAWFRDPFSDTVAFLLSTTVIATLLSILAGFTAYVLFKRRGGKVEKNEPPAGVLPQRKHFGPPPAK